MLSHYEALTRIKAAKLVAILRHVPTERLDGVVEALMAGGVPHHHRGGGQAAWMS